MCKRRKATLLIAKLDRLARNVAFVSALLEEGCEFVAADMPHAGKVMIQMSAVMADWERDQIAARTRIALQAAKTRGVKLCNPQNLSPYLAQRALVANDFARGLLQVIAGFLAQKFKQVRMVEELNQLGIKAPRGERWSRVQLQRVLARVANSAIAA